MVSPAEGDGSDDLFRPGAVAVRLLLALNEWSQARLAKEARCDQGLISLLQRGKRDPDPELLERLARAAGWPLALIEGMARAAIRVHRLGGGLGSVGGASLAEAAEMVGAEIASRLEAALPEIETLLAAPPQASEPTERDRETAENLWLRLADLGDRQRQLLIDLSPAFHLWALALRIGEASTEAACERPADALSLAELAVEIAKRSLGPKAFVTQVRALALGPVGNAHRVAGDLDAARAAFAEARLLWPAGAPPASELLSEVRLLDLEASLRRDLREFDIAHALLDRAFALAPEAPVRAGLLLKRSTVFEQQGDPESSLAAARRSLEELGDVPLPRLHMLAQCMQVLNLDHLGRHEQVLEATPAARELAAELGSEANLRRLLWLEARARAAIGQGEAAIEAVERVRREFAANGQLHDAALAALELAALYLDRGRSAETRALAEDLVPLFKAQGIRRETLAAVRLFLEAARREEATAALAREAVAELRKG